MKILSREVGFIYTWLLEASKNPDVWLGIYTVPKPDGEWMINGTDLQPDDIEMLDEDQLSLLNSFIYTVLRKRDENSIKVHSGDDRTIS